VTAAMYWWRSHLGSTWRGLLAIVVVGGLLGAVSLGALAGARRTASAYSRYLTSTNASDAQVNIPGLVPGIPVLRPMTLISHLPGVSRSAVYIGMDAYPVLGGKVDDAWQVNDVTGTLSSSSFGADGFSQDKMTVLAGRLPSTRSTDQVVLTPGIAARLGVGVGGTVTYLFSNTENPSPGIPTVRPVRRTFRVAAIVAVPPVLTDQSDVVNATVLPPGATRQLIAYYQFGWVGVRLDRGAAGIPELQHHLASLASTVEQQIPQPFRAELGGGLTFNISSSVIIHDQVQQAIRPQALALAIFGAIAALAMLVLVGQGLARLISRAAGDISVMRGLGATRAQVALTVGLPASVAVVGSVILAVAGAIALSPLAPVGPIRQFDPDRGLQADALVLGGGSAVLIAALLAMLSLMAMRAVRHPGDRPATRASDVARFAAAAGLPASAVVGSRNALEPGSRRQAAPVRASLIGSVAAVTAVMVAAVFGASLNGLITHPAQYGWNWSVLIQAEGGYGNWTPGALAKLIDGRPEVTGWSELGFSSVPLGRDGAIVPVLGVQRHSGTVEPPTTSGHPIDGSGQIELGTVTMRQLGVHVGQSIPVGQGPHRKWLTVVGTVTLPSFGVARSDHVSLGRGAMMSEDELLTVLGVTPAEMKQALVSSQAAPSAAAIDLAPGTTISQRARLVGTITSANPDGTPGGTYQLTQFKAAAIENASQMGGQPLALALGLAAAAVLSLGVTVLADVRRRRRELALLKALGMTRRQVRAIVAWQTSITLGIAVLIGIPLGVVAGRLAWRAFAGSLGVAPVTVVPILLAAAGAAALLMAGNALTSVPGAIAARTSPSIALRAE
jgi:putative ABC transport system permease protein